MLIDRRDSSRVLCNAARLVRPFARVLRSYPSIPGEMIAELEALDPDDRVPIPIMMELLRGAVELTGDPDIGLKAAREVSIGDAGALELVVSGARSVRAAVELVGRFVPLINEGLEFSLHVEGDRAIVRLDNLVALPRAAIDYQSGAFYVSALHRRPAGATPAFDVLFMHARPERVEEYERTFAPGRLCFGAAFNGFAFDRRYLELSLPSVDPALHRLLREHAERVLADLPRAQRFTEKVRSLILRDLASGTSTAARTAGLLHVSQRTFRRKLRQGGTSFKELHDDVRRGAALRYVATGELALLEIAFLLGFSEAASFHRAFKRWTGQTPREYRRARKH
jgi:AraC-like DNA-binding protein